MYSNGYKFVAAGSKDGQKTISVHRLVAELFIPNPNNYPVVNHLDGNKLNNRADNLEWTTQLENNRHAIETGLVKSVCKIKRKAIVTNLKTGEKLFFDTLKDCGAYFGKKKWWVGCSILQRKSNPFIYKGYEILRV